MGLFSSAWGKKLKEKIEVKKEKYTKDKGPMFKKKEGKSRNALQAARKASRDRAKNTRKKKKVLFKK